MNDLIALPQQDTSFALEATRAYFIRQRNIDGANTPLGHRWSNLVGQTWSLHFAKTQDQRDNLMISIARTTLQIRNLKRGDHGPVLLSPPQLLLTFQTIH